MSQIQIQALLNEYKGNLFEFAVAQKLAKRYGHEYDFHRQLPDSFLLMLQNYEKQIRNYHRALINQINQLASATVAEILKNDLFSMDHAEVFLIGKIAGGSHDERWSEADIIVKNIKNEILLSLKLAKNNSFVNAKSAGLKSFYQKYFPDDLKDELQVEFNRLIQRDFTIFCYELYQSEGLEFAQGFDEWINLGFPELPGGLKPEQHQSLMKYYQKITSFIYQSFTKLEQHNPNYFNRMCDRLVGIGDDHLIQVICFHSGTLDHEYVKTLILGHEILGHELEQPWALKDYNAERASFDIHSHSKILQVRVKAMNKFTSPSLKINCSVKYQQ